MNHRRVLAFEKTNGPIARGSAVLLRTGWSRHWPNATSYLGDATPGDASKLSFPSYGVDAARLLVDERNVGALLIALPMKIEGGSGGPLRAIALVPRP